MDINSKYQRFEAFAHDCFRWKFSRDYSERQMRDAKCDYKNWKTLSKEQKKEIVEYWGLKHPVKSDFLTHEIMLNAKGVFDVRYCPEKVFRVYIDPTLSDKRLMWAWDDKNYFDRFQPSVPFPHIYVRNIRGYFLDHDYNPISREEAKQLIFEHLPLIIKPSVMSGEGRGLKLLSDRKQAEEILAGYDRDYVVQEVITQCDVFAKMGSKCANIFRIITAMVDGEPKHLTGHLMCNTTDVIAVNTAPKIPGTGTFFVKINEENKLEDTGYFENAKKIKELPNGFAFGGLEIPAYREAVNIALEAHKSMPMLGFIGWDITVDKSGKPVFFEWNIRGIEIYHSQLTNGPLFGQYSDYFAEMARNLIKNW